MRERESQDIEEERERLRMLYTSLNWTNIVTPKIINTNDTNEIENIDNVWDTRIYHTEIMVSEIWV